MSDNDRCMRLRPHHILCARFISIEPPGRGENFDILSRRIRDLLISQEEMLIEVTQGVDDLCGPAPTFQITGVSALRRRGQGQAMGCTDH